MIQRVFPQGPWQKADPADAGMDARKLADAHRWLGEYAANKDYSYAVLRHGWLVDEHSQGIDPAQTQPMCSICKSVYCSMLGIAVAEGKIRSADDRLTDYYPQIRQAVGVEFGPFANPKKKEYLTEAHMAVTLRQLASQIGGFMIADQVPGAKWHYQTFGMMVLMHAISHAYGYYDPDDVMGKPGDGELIREKLRDPIGGAWWWEYNNWTYQQDARFDLYSNMPWLHLSVYDMLRLGWLWCNQGRWGERQIIPELWQRESAGVSPLILNSQTPPEDYRYGYGFWVNQQGRLWPTLPRDSYCAAGFGSRMIWMCPSLDLVVVQCPGVYANMKMWEEDSLLLPRIVDACVS